MQNEKANTILVLGGTGKTGRRVANRLIAEGLPVRIGSRSAQPSFDWENQQTWLPALKGVETVYVTYYSDLAFPGAAGMVRAFAGVAVNNGVRRLVLLSGRGEEGAQLAEQYIRDSGAEWTIVRASWFNQNFSENFFVEPLLAGEVAFPAGDVAEPFIDADDIADVAAAALADTQGKHAGQVYEVTGPRLLTFADAIAEISRATGRPIRYSTIPADDYLSGLIHHGVPPDFANPLVDLIKSVLDGRNSRLTDGVQRALGRPPRDFADYARETAATGVWTPAPGATPQEAKQ